MRTVILVCSLAAVAAFATAAEPPSLTGKWLLHLSIVGNENDATCQLNQNGNELTGTCGAEQGTAQLSGKIEDKKVAWSYKIDYNGQPLTLKYAGTLASPEKITGSVTVEEFGVEGEFTATQAK
jgi:hypothetical protein